MSQRPLGTSDKRKDLAAMFLNWLFTLGGRLFNPLKRKHVLKCAESPRCKFNTLGIFACNFSMFLKVSQRDLF